MTEYLDTIDDWLHFIIKLCLKNHFSFLIEVLSHPFSNQCTLSQIKIRTQSTIRIIMIVFTQSLCLTVNISCEWGTFICHGYFHNNRKAKWLQFRDFAPAFFLRTFRPDSWPPQKLLEVGHSRSSSGDQKLPIPDLKYFVLSVSKCFFDRPRYLQIKYLLVW